MRAPREDPLVQASARRHPIENLLVQFSILSFVIMTILGIALSVILTTRLGRDFEILKEQAAAAESAGVAVPEVLSTQQLDAELGMLRWTTYVAVGGGFVILYTGLIWIFWRGWRTIGRQQSDLMETYGDLRAAYLEIQDAKEEERKRLAEDLHDDTMAELASVAVDLGFLSRHPGKLPPDVKGGEIMYHLGGRALRCGV